MFKVGQIVTKSALIKGYDAYVVRVLDDYLEEQDRIKREQTKYKVLQALPSKAEYLEMKTKKYTVTVTDLVSDAYGIVESLQGEMEEAYGNMPYSFQDTDLGQRRSDAAEALGNVASNSPDVPEAVGNLRGVFLPHLDTGSRAKQAGEAVDMMETAAMIIREHAEDEAMADLDIESIADQLENDATELAAVEFPGMYG